MLFLDLIQEGNLGLIKAVRSLILEKGLNLEYLCYMSDKTGNN